MAATRFKCNALCIPIKRSSKQGNQRKKTWNKIEIMKTRFNHDVRKKRVIAFSVSLVGLPSGEWNANFFRAEWCLLPFPVKSWARLYCCLSDISSSRNWKKEPGCLLDYGMKRKWQTMKQTWQALQFLTSMLLLWKMCSTCPLGEIMATTSLIEFSNYL